MPRMIVVSVIRAGRSKPARASMSSSVTSSGVSCGCQGTLSSALPRELERQYPPIGHDRRQAGLGDRGQGAVQPVHGAADPRPNEHVIEHARARQARVEPVVGAAVAGKDGLGFDAKLGEKREKQSGLALAVAVAALPGEVGGGRRELAIAEADKDVADLLLDELESGARTIEHGRMGGGDPPRLLMERRAGIEPGRRCEERGEEPRDRGPVREIAILHQPRKPIARRRVARGRDHRRVVEVQGQGPGAALRDGRHVRGHPEVRLPPLDPAQPEAEPALCRIGRENEQAGIIAAKGRIAGAGREADFSSSPTRRSGTRRTAVRIPLRLAASS